MTHHTNIDRSRTATTQVDHVDQKTVVGDRGLRSTDYERYAYLVDQRDAEDRDEDFVQIARLGLPFCRSVTTDPEVRVVTSNQGGRGFDSRESKERQSNNSRVTMVHNYLYSTNETYVGMVLYPMRCGGHAVTST